jgi:hypothetical protein
MKKRSKIPQEPYSPSALGGGGMPFPGIPLRTYDILLGDNVKVIEDKKSKARVANFPFEFPDGARGVVILCRIEDEPWIPNKTITKITLQFHD